MADQKIIAAPAKPEVKAAPHPRRPVGWCVAKDLPEGHTLQDVPREQILKSAAEHEAKWRGRFNAQQVASQATMNWTRG